MPTQTPQQQFTDDDFVSAIEDSLSGSPIVTSSGIADRVGCSRELARQRLVTLAEDGKMVSEKVGGGAKVYYPEGTADAALETLSESNADPSDDGSVLFFPSRREIVTHDPDPDTRSTLSQTAHLVDSQGDGFMYKVSSEDVWNTPHDDFSDYRSALQSVVGDDWDDGFESRIKNDWADANTFRLRTHEDGYPVLESNDPDDIENIAKRHLEYNDHYTQYVDENTLRLKYGSEAGVKEALYDAGYPAEDARRLDTGQDLDVQLTDEYDLRDYQQNWVDSFADRKAGTFVGPSGSGKTVAALGAMEAIGGETLILVPRRELASQWREEVLEKTTLSSRQVGEYHGGTKQVRPVTIATYDTAAMTRHRDLFNENPWGLVIADECHHAAASTWKRFRSIQSKARLGLSATPVRESGDAKEIYTLLGPPVGTDWGSLFANGWVSKPDVNIVMVPWGSEKARERYEHATGSGKLMAAASNPKKPEVVRTLLDRHSDEKAIVFVDYIDQGDALSDALDAPFISGETPHDRREHLYDDFREGNVQTLIVSRVGDEGIDLPDAGVAILTSTMGSSNAQTGQRSGRTMRPDGESEVYILLTKGSGEADWGRESTQFLAEQGIDITRTDYDDFGGL